MKRKYMSFEIYEFANSEEKDYALAKNFAALIKGSLEILRLRGLQDSLVLAFSGGKSPIVFLNHLSKEKLQWEKCYISLVDERIVNTEHEDSNTKLLHTHLLENHAKNAAFIPMLKNEWQESLQIDEIVKLANTGYKQPDFAILGMGNDGHTASLFSNAKEFEYAITTEDNIVSTTPKDAPYQRLSLSLNALQKCKKLFLSISGEEKFAILQEALKGINPLLPISYIFHSRKVCCDVYYSR